MPVHHFPIRVPGNMLEALGEFTGIYWADSLALEPFICEAIQNYMKPVPPPEQLPAASSEHGYQWKQVFLPDGTRLRASYRGKPYFAVVKGPELRCGEEVISPSAFANLQGSGNRNAWQAIWLRFPDGDGWLLADVCRCARNAALSRLYGGGIRSP